MKRLEMSNKTFLMRHWFKWYIVSRGAKDWDPLGHPKNRKRTRAFDLDKTAKAMSQRAKGLPDILNEAVADKEVAKNLPKR